MKRVAIINLAGVDWEKLHEQGRIDAANPLAGWEAPRILPPAWIEDSRDQNGARYRSELLSLVAICSGSYEADGRAWLHLSVSHRSREPKWRELVECKELFLGDREAYKVLPPKSRYINIHPHVLHLFALLDPTAAALPDFTRGTGSL